MDAAERVAALLIGGFDDDYGRFRAVSADAKQLFEAADWHGIHAAVRERIRLEHLCVDDTVERVRSELGRKAQNDKIWRRAKLRYTERLIDHRRPELAETFFNSVSTRVLGRGYLHNDFMFVRATISTEYIPSDPPTYRSYYPKPRLAPVFEAILSNVGWQRPFVDLPLDAERIGRTIAPLLTEPRPNLQIRVLASPFYRNKAAYVIGKVVNGNDEVPFAIAVVHGDENRLAVDAVITAPRDIDILFSLSRSYFIVDMDVPSAYVDFLRTIMPTKPRSELYSSLGLEKQGKTLFFRDLLYHLAHSEDQFVEAPGARGQVMAVFTLPSYPYVFKLIRDHFGPTKNTTRDEVMRKFQIVKEVDRVGRMVDALEFVDLALPLDRFAPTLLEELNDLTPSSIAVEGGELVVKHCYVERKMTPLDIQLREATDDADHVVREYGNTLRELAIANIFPGDLLWRNFGLTRHGRVVCYDYDELEYLTDCVFRDVPDAPDLDQELSAEAWYGVGPMDVFPEEFSTFLLGAPGVREPFMRHHAELLRPEFWRDAQRRVAAGEVVDFFPYRDELRFCNRFEVSEPAAPRRAG
ncbi:MAG: bifunctional isocitrate dehydrogenase kinase/phosphatase [Actinobacteria bacterium]|nr:bifunctional isocitrate dehydrogenase kinase/phosphatase [Actinomycetota bacterium]